MKEWHKNNQKFKFGVWKDYIFKDTQATWHMEFWFSWMAYFMEVELKELIEALHKTQTKTQDQRYLDQLLQMTGWVQETLNKCRRTIGKNAYAIHNHEFPCSCFQDRFSCYSHKRPKVLIKNTKTYMCHRAKDALMQDVYDVLHGFLVSWLSDSYYVWKLYQEKRINFPVYIFDMDVKFLHFDDIGSWEPVCGDEEKEILSHPSLPHPSDFLEKRKIIGSSYADKARFEYQMPGSLDKNIVVFTKKKSIIPKIKSLIHHEDQVSIVKTPSQQSQMYFQGTTSQHKNGTPKKKRKMSEIMKESRKKNKKRHRSSDNDFHQSFTIEQGEEYDVNVEDVDDYSCCSYYYFD